MNQTIEPIIIRDPTLSVFGRQQSNVLPDPDAAKPLGREGQFLGKKLPSEEQILSRYWMQKRKQISILGIVSAGILGSILANETNILNIIFGTIANLIWQAIGLVWGLIF